MSRKTYKIGISCRVPGLTLDEINRHLVVISKKTCTYAGFFIAWFNSMIVPAQPYRISLLPGSDFFAVSAAAIFRYRVQGWPPWS